MVKELTPRKEVPTDDQVNENFSQLFRLPVFQQNKVVF